MHPSNLRRRKALAWALAAAASPTLPLATGCASRGTGLGGDAFAMGIASGSPRPDGMVLWTRLTPQPELPSAVPVSWELAADEGFRQVLQRGEVPAEATWGHSVHVEVRGLLPSRWYWYRFTALGQRSPIGRTRTAPAPGALEPLSFAIASCQRWDHGFYAAWHHMAEESPDLVVFLGDYIYEYPPVPNMVRSHEGVGPCHTLAQYRARYAQYKSDVNLQRMHASAPWIVTWDDHEVENDYAGDQSQTLIPGFLLRRAAAYQAWWEHMPVPHALRPDGPDLPLFGRFDWGALASFHVLDDRQYRDPQSCPPEGRGGSRDVALSACPDLLRPDRTLLGLRQEAWLAESLVRSRAGWNFLAQQTLMAPFTWSAQGTYWTDGWSGYPAARSRLLDTLAERRVANPVVLSGDVHANCVADLKRQPDDPVVIATEFCGTSISSRGMAQSRMDAAVPLNPHLRHARSDERGYVGFRLTPRGLDASLRVLSDVRDPHATVRTSARFHVAPGKAGAQSD